MSKSHFPYERFYTKTRYETEVKKKTSTNLAASIPRTFSTSAVLLDVVAVPLTPEDKHDNYPIREGTNPERNRLNLFRSMEFSRMIPGVFYLG